MKTVSVSDFRRGVSAILDSVENGEKICIRRHHKVIAMIVPPESRRPKPAWKQRGLRLVIPSVSLSTAVLEERQRYELD